MFNRSDRSGNQFQTPRIEEPLVDALVKFQAMLRLAVDHPDQASSILAKLIEPLREEYSEPELLLMRAHRPEVRMKLGEILGVEEMARPVFSIELMQNCLEKIIPSIKALAADPYLCAAFVPSLLGPLLYKNFTVGDSRKVTEVSAAIFETRLTTAGRTNIRNLLAFSILTEYTDQLESPPIGEYQKATGLTESPIFPNTTTADLLLRHIIHTHITLKSPIPPELWDGTPSELETKICATLLPTKGSPNDRALKFDDVLSWFVQQCGEIKTLLQQLTSQLLYYPQDVSSAPPTSAVSLREPNTTPKPSVEEFMSFAHRLTGAMKILTAFCAARERSSDCRSAALGTRARRQLEDNLGSTIYSLINCYTSFDHPPAFPIELIKYGITPINELFAFSFDDSAHQKFYTASLPVAMKKAMQALDFTSAYALRFLAPTSSEDSSERSGVDDYINDDQPFIIDRVSELSVRVGNFINKQTQGPGKSNERRPELLSLIEPMLREVESGRYLLTDKTLASNDPQLNAGVSTLIAALISYNQSVLEDRKCRDNLAQNRYDELHRASKLLGCFQNKFAGQILIQVRSRIPSFNSFVRDYILNTNQDFERALQHIGTGENKLPISAVLPTYDHALAALRLHSLVEKFDSSLPVPIIRQLKDPLSPAHIGFSILHLEEELKTPPTGLPHITMTDLPFLYFIAGTSLTKNGTDLRREKLSAFYTRVLANPGSVQRSSMWLIIKAAEQYALQCDTLFKSGHNLPKNQVAEKLVHLLLPLRFDLRVVPNETTAAYALVLSRIFSTPVVREVFGDSTCENIKTSFQDFALTLIIAGTPKTNPTELFLSLSPLRDLATQLGFVQSSTPKDRSLD